MIWPTSLSRPGLLAVESGHVDVLGLDDSAHNQWEWSGPGEGTNLATHPALLADIITGYGARYRLQCILGETNIRGFAPDRATWLKWTLERCELARSRGVDVGPPRRQPRHHPAMAALAGHLVPRSLRRLAVRDRQHGPLPMQGVELVNHVLHGEPETVWIPRRGATGYGDRPMRLLAAGGTRVGILRRR